MFGLNAPVSPPTASETLIAKHEEAKRLRNEWLAKLAEWASPEEDIRDGWRRFRVPGGWLYRNTYSVHGSTPVFVPFVECPEHDPRQKPVLDDPRPKYLAVEQVATIPKYIGRSSVFERSNNEG